MMGRAQLWGALGPGVFHTCEAFRVFVASVVMFGARLRPLPVNFSAAETSAYAELFPGPGAWASAECLTQLRDLGFPCELMDIRCASVAAKARVCHYEDAQPAACACGDGRVSFGIAGRAFFASFYRCESSGG